MVGLGVMGKNLLLNMADHGFAIAGFDLDPVKADSLADEAEAGQDIEGTIDPAAFAQMLKTPRALMLLVPAGKPVDAAIAMLLPHLTPGDIIVDGGNSYFVDTDRRYLELSEKGIHFFGMGISGGEKGARFGPSMMPGGDRVAYERLRPVFEAVAAKVDGEPCVEYMGNGSAGNYVKMVHNGIEYALMQLIAEAYDLLRRGIGLSDEKLQATFESWNNSELQSYLIEITAQILQKEDDLSEGKLVHVISDKARSKGTGKWTSQNAMDLQAPIPVIDTAVMMRDLSKYKEDRVLAAEKLVYTANLASHADEGFFVEQVKNALYMATIITYAQGFAQLRAASIAYNYELDLEEVAKIWRGGCIIRAVSLADFREAFKRDRELPNLLLDDVIAGKLVGRQSDLREVLTFAIKQGIPLAAFAAALSYFDAYRSAVLPTNIIQAQRDFFGAHLYARTDREGVFHTDWDL